MKCKYVEINQKESKCTDYYYSHRAKGGGCMCRLPEWKKKLGVCPYDKNIKSHSKRDKHQKAIEELVIARLEQMPSNLRLSIG